LADHDQDNQTLLRRQRFRIAMWLVIGAVAFKFTAGPILSLFSTGGLSLLDKLVMVASGFPVLAALVLIWRWVTPGRGLIGLVGVGFLLVSLLGFVVGLLRGNDLYYLLGDTFRYGVVPTTVWLLGVTMALHWHQEYGFEEAKDRVYRLMTILILTVALTDVLSVALQTMAVNNEHEKIHGGFAVFGLAWALYGRGGGAGTRWGLATLAIASLLLTNKRANYLLLVLVAAPYALVGAQAAWRRILAVVVAVALLLLVAPLLRQQDGYLGLLAERVEYTTDSLERIVRTRGDESFGARLDEVRNVEHFFQDRPHLMLLGAGYGAEVPMEFNTGVYSKNGLMHHLHISWAEFYLRTGVVGTLFHALFFMACAWWGWQLMRGRDQRFRFVPVVLAIYFVLTFKSFVFRQAIVLPMLAAMGAVAVGRVEVGQPLPVRRGGSES